METLGTLPDIPTFDGEPVPMSRNPLTSGTRPLQLLPLPGIEFPVRYEMGRMRGFQAECSSTRQSLEQLRDATIEMRGAAVEVRDASVLRMPNFEQLRDAAVELRGAGAEVDLGKARSGGSATDVSAFWDLLDPPIRARVVAAGFGDYAAGLRRTQPHFSPAMRYALMERWNDCTHTFVFGFGEMTLTPVDYAAITSLRFTGPVAPLDARYQTTTLGAQLVRSLFGVTTQTRYTAQGCVSYEVVYQFWAESIRTRLAAWRELPVEARTAAPADSREERDQAARSFLFYTISSQLLCTSQNKGDPRGASMPEGLELGRVLRLGHFSFGSFLSRSGCLDPWRIPRYLAHCHHTYASGEDPEYWRSFLNDRELSDRTYPGREVAELHARSRFLMRGYWADRYFLGERVYDTPVAPSQRRVPHAPPRHMCLLEGLTREDLEARLPEILEYTQERKMHKTAAHYRAEAAAEAGTAVAPARPAEIILGDVPFPPGMEVALDPDLGLGSGITIPADLRWAPPLPQLDPEHAIHDLEIGRLRRHQSRQSSAVIRLQVEVDRLRTKLEVEGIPLDSSDEDDDGSSDDAPSSLPPHAAAGPSRRRR
ncbi:hypothetical protein JCGZ_18147 [Jatropha curcas]|uniref:Aminotransferase-like plant mobile domain-containing protein n=1 Tax=Jatropha curcas TaxID=180498 RepID=A0A067KEW6_JATCU|nr:hypothetical protein JCGZ_18147 [Jatropha curcas]